MPIHNPQSVLIIDTQHPYYQQVLTLRQMVLRAPLGLNILNDDLSDEANQLIFVFVQEETVKGCLLLQQYSATTFKLRQMAVANETQGQGLGAALIAAAETYSTQLGKQYIRLHAREYAIPFYLKQGYEVISDLFEEVGIPHRIMEKVLV